jgi:chorismate dehydratase
VFAMWTARPAAEVAGLGSPLRSARDRGLARLSQIARRSSAELDLAEAECLEYLRDALVFHLGPRQRQGLERFADLAIGHGLAPEDSRLEFAD